MIIKIVGKFVEKKEQSLIINVHGVFYEILVPLSVLERINAVVDAAGNVELIVYHYFQLSPGNGFPWLIGFLNEVERDFFLQFIKISGIGPKAAVKALNKPISEIAKAIEEGRVDYLKSLPGIGPQRAKEIVAKLQGKVGRFGLIQDREVSGKKEPFQVDWQQEALEVLLQLQYRRQEAQAMIEEALKRPDPIESTEELLNEIYKIKIKD